MRFASVGGSHSFFPCINSNIVHHINSRRFRRTLRRFELLFEAAKHLIVIRGKPPKSWGVGGGHMNLGLA